MELDDTLRADLAGFFARRFPSTEARGRLAGAAGLPAADLPADPRRAWDALVDRAVTRGRLLALVDAAGAAAPGDPNLLEIRRLLAGPAPAPKPGVPARVAFLGGLGVAAALVGIGVTLGARMDDAAPAPTVTEAPVVAPPVVTAPVTAEAMPTAEGEPTAPAAEVPAPEAPAPEAEAPAAPPVPEPRAEPRPPTPSSTAASVSPAPSGCAGPAGTVLGWWYTNRGRPGDVGDVVTVPTNANVRVDFPRPENRFARGADVLCTLRAGTRQRLSHAPVSAGGDQWWVPVAGGDLAGE